MPAARSTTLLLRPAAERFHSRLDWLDSWHSFSFAGHDDPAWRGFGPLRVINDDTIAAGSGFGRHPHRDMEIVTVMVEGELRHGDSIGHSEVLRPGEVQRMSAGTGIVHSEWNGSAAPCRLLQIWIEPSSHGIAPAYGQKRFAPGPQWTLLLDPDARDGAMAIHRPVRLWRAQPAAGQELPLAIAPDSLGWIQLIEGGGLAEGPSAAQGETGSTTQGLERGDGLGFAPAALRRFTAGAAGADLLLFELR